MCGIFAVIKASQSTRDELTEKVELGIKKLRHRGPDGDGIWVDSSARIGFGHVRLTILDLYTGDQPMKLEDGTVIIFNGEIYNYIELRDELGSSNFSTTSDTEVILRAYQKWGESCVDHLRGMFAFLIWDPAKEKVFLARDRFGIKPLYWYKDNQGDLYFSSEIKALLPFIDRRDVNITALSDYFTFQFCLGEKTLVNGVSQMPAAHCATFKPGGAIAPKKYWEVHYEIDYSHTEKWFIEKLSELLHDSIRVHLRADVEVGSYVSGGVDSSLMAAMGRSDRRSNNFKVFNGRFLDGDGFDESSYAESLADKHDLELHITDITEQDFVDYIEKVIWHLDQPTAGPGSFPQYMVSKSVGEHIKVVLGGQGGDEIFGGYARYLVAYFEQCIKGAIEGTLHNGNYVVTYESIIQNLETLRQYKPMLREFWSDGLFEERDNRYWRLINRANTFSDVISADALDQRSTLAEFKEIYWGENVGKEAYFDSMTHFDFKTLLPALLQVEDRMSMAHGVEARVPLLDHPLVEFAATIPADIKFRDGQLKKLLKTVFSGYLPNEIVERKDKMGFPVPLNLWLKRGGVARDFIGDILGSKQAQSRSYLKDGVRIDEVLNSQGAFGRNLWALLSLELWHRQFIDQNAS